MIRTILLILLVALFVRLISIILVILVVGLLVILLIRLLRHIYMNHMTLQPGLMGVEPSYHYEPYDEGPNLHINHIDMTGLTASNL
jgi:hypothetical protein